MFAGVPLTINVILLGEISKTVIISRAANVDAYSKSLTAQLFHKKNCRDHPSCLIERCVNDFKSIITGNWNIYDAW